MDHESVITKDGYTEVVSNVHEMSSMHALIYWIEGFEAAGNGRTPGGQDLRNLYSRIAGSGEVEIEQDGEWEKRRFKGKVTADTFHGLFSLIYWIKGFESAPHAPKVPGSFELVMMYRSMASSWREHND